MKISEKLSILNKGRYTDTEKDRVDFMREWFSDEEWYIYGDKVLTTEGISRECWVELHIDDIATKKYKRDFYLK